MLQIEGDTRKERLLNAVKGLNFRFPKAQISKDTGYSKGIVSSYLNGAEPSENFVRTFCETYNITFEAIWGQLPKNFSEGSAIAMYPAKDAESTLRDKYIALLEKRESDINLNEIKETGQAIQARLMTLFQHLAKLRAEVEKVDQELIEEEMHKDLDANFRHISKKGI